MSEQPDRERALEMARRSHRLLGVWVEIIADTILEARAEESERAAEVDRRNPAIALGVPATRRALEESIKGHELRAAQLRSQKTTALSNSSTATTGPGKP